MGKRKKERVKEQKMKRKKKSKEKKHYRVDKSLRGGEKEKKE